MEAVIEKTTKKDQEIALSSIRKFDATSKKLARGGRNYVTISIQGSEEPLEVPKKAFILLFDIIKNMAKGRSIALIPSESEISTQDAADILNVSRPHLVKLLEEGEIPYKKVGTHRRVNFNDILLYEQKLKKNRDEKLDFLGKQAQELNLGY